MAVLAGWVTTIGVSLAAEPREVPAATGGRWVASVGFDLGSDRLDEEAMRIVREVAGALDEQPLAHAILEAHSDEPGSRELNLALAERRSRRVLEALVQMGVAAWRVQVRPFGEERVGPSAGVVQRVDVVVQASDRRVEPRAASPGTETGAGDRPR